MRLHDLHDGRAINYLETYIKKIELYNTTSYYSPDHVYTIKKIYIYHEY